MAKRSSPALYELIRHRGGERVSPMPVDDCDPIPSAAPIIPHGSWLRPGRSIQVPVGYLFVAIALVLLLLILTYVMAYGRGVQAERLSFHGDLESVANGQRSGPMFDPLSVDDGSDSLAQVSGGERARQRAERAQPRSWGPIESDPRQRGRAYFILAQTTEAGALRLAEFCRERGLEAYVVSGNNVRLRRVIALPGIPPDRLTGEQARQLRQAIHEVGHEWSQAGLGRWDYHEAYLSEYR